jgi:hypothetical protein
LAEPACEVCGGPLSTGNELGVCNMSEACTREYRRRWKRNWARAHPGEVRARNIRQRERRRGVLAEREREWREANPGFLADWFEAPPQARHGFYEQWAAAHPEQAAAIRADVRHIRKVTGRTPRPVPTLARLTFDGGREPVYGIGGAAARLDAYPGEGSGILPRSWAHAEGDVFHQAAERGYRGGEAVLAVTRLVCRFCSASFPGYIAWLGLASLAVPPRRRSAPKRAAVLAVLADCPGASHAEVARMAGVTCTYVRMVRELVPESVGSGSGDEQRRA